MTAAERVFIGLGGNVGDVRSALAAAFDALDRLRGTRVTGRSSLYRSAPIDAGGADYLNAVAELATTLEPIELLQALQRIEADAGRERPYRNAPRTLDLDVLLYGQRQIESDSLTLPHPRLQHRAFVLRPLLELAPGIAHPALGPLADYVGAVTDQVAARLP
ncbi:MAG: 2-amino-4-hydroxy-6-hydroxymethyldihydropteridine diphosphokinase [Pseudomonadota bacterium]|nr:2-amino-4-hydroxy-6-hydroxymethyldihydropteridine diphosphokinase [Pseudomonadota bacterium]